MADSDHNNDSQVSDSTDLAAAYCLLGLNSTNDHDNDSEVWDCIAITAANSLLHLRCSWQTLRVKQDICETNLPIKKRPYNPGHCRGDNAPSTRESIRALANVSHSQRYAPGAASELLIKKMPDNKDDDSGEESGGRPGNCNSLDQTAAVIPEESGHKNQTHYRLETIEDPAEIMFKHWRRFRSSQSYDREQSTGPPREPASRYLPPEDCLCFVKTLALTDVSHVDGKLNLERFTAMLIPSCPLILKEAHGERKSVELMVFDYENTQYNMELTGHNFEGTVAFSINGEWRKFIFAHNLQHGDRIFFCRNRDPMINPNDFYYVILFEKIYSGEE